MKLVKGAQSIAYDRAPYLISSASVVGKKEGEGPIGEMFDLVGESDLLNNFTHCYILPSDQFFLRLAETSA